MSRYGNYKSQFMTDIKEINKSIEEIDNVIKEISSREFPNYSIINSLKAKKALLKLNKDVKK